MSAKEAEMDLLRDNGSWQDNAEAVWDGIVVIASLFSWPIVWLLGKLKNKRAACG
jgi:hypothetical protein